MDLQEIFKIINSGGVFGLFVIILVGGFRKWWTWGWAYREMESRLQSTEQERDDWRQLALHGTSLAEQTVHLFRSRGN